MKSLQAISYKLQVQKGFTLLESIIAIGIFTVGISVSINLISSSLTNAGVRTRDKIIAGYLAQEGIEAVRSIRDNNWIAGNSWLANITSCATAGCAQSNGCVAWNGDTIDFSGTCQRNLIFNGASSPPAYQSTAGLAQFSRAIGVDMVSPAEIQLTSTVTCGMNCSVTLQEYLYDWK